jgi:hypothetical protein
MKHGGMDFILVYRLIECMRNGLGPEVDVYDAAAWSAPGPLSELSVARGSAPLKSPTSREAVGNNPDDPRGVTMRWCQPPRPLGARCL